MLKKISITALLTTSVVISCGRIGDEIRTDSTNASNLMEEWDTENDPVHLADDYTHIFSDLLLEGKIDQNPWPDSYWPSYQGGISARWNWRGQMDRDEDGEYKLYTKDELLVAENNSIVKQLSPAEKYDLLRGDYDYKMVQTERERTDPSQPSWWGLCHGWAAASLNFAEPKPVLMTNADGLEIEFGSSDIKALLTYAQQYRRFYFATKFLGGRCDDDLDTDPDAGDKPQCKDVNAGSFHIVIANELGKYKRGFVADITRDAEVWNQPVVGFTSKIIDQTDEVYETAAPGTVKIVHIETELAYGVESQPRWEPQVPDNNDDHITTRRLNYTIEIDQNGAIIGGEWVTGERPDFMWRQTPPAFRGFFTELAELYEKAILD